MRIGIFATLCVLLAACGGDESAPTKTNTGVYMLLDTSGTYTENAVLLPLEIRLIVNCFDCPAKINSKVTLVWSTL